MFVSWGCGSLTVVNLFAYRATKPSKLKEIGRDTAIESMQTTLKGFGCSCFDLLHNGGMSVYMDFLRNHSDGEIVKFVKGKLYQVVDVSRYDKHPQVSFFTCRACK